jgi:hypothetical protein
MQFLVFTHDVGETDWSAQGQLLKNEARAVWALINAGSLRNIWFTESKDAVLLFEEENMEKVAAVMNGLPLVAQGLIDYRIHELKPYTGFERLFNGTDR